MKRCTGAVLVVLAVALPGARHAAAEPLATDVNIVTALDISDSISLDDIRLELQGMAQAIQDARVHRAIQAGANRRIGFAVFAWHRNRFPVAVPWMVIASPEDARRAARAIEARMLVNVAYESREGEQWYIGRLTDLSQAIDHASEMLRLAPFAGARMVINIVGNGEDNVGEEADAARDRFVARAGTINGLVLGDDSAMVAYYGQQVIGGPGAFVMSTADPPSMADAFVRKFLADMVAAVPDDPDARRRHQGPAISGGL